MVGFSNALFFRSGQKSIVIRLLEYNADVNKKDVEGRSALMASSYKNHFDIVSILLQAGADPNVSAFDKTNSGIPYFTK